LPATPAPVIYVAIGQRIRKAREERRCSQAELAKHAGLTRTSICNIERGRQHVPLHTLYAIARVLAIQPMMLLPRMKTDDDGLDRRLARKVQPDLHAWVASVVVRRTEVEPDAEP
jgi:transcriptional regulator with XRE-family HTH domain